MGNLLREKAYWWKEKMNDYVCDCLELIHLNRSGMQSISDMTGTLNCQ